MLSNLEGEMTEINIDNSQTGGAFFSRSRNRSPQPSGSQPQQIEPQSQQIESQDGPGGYNSLIALVKNLDIDNASIILNIHKINMLNSNESNASKFFYILDKSVRKYLKKNKLFPTNASNINDKIYNDIYNDMLNNSDESSSGADTSSEVPEDLKTVLSDNYFKNYNNLNYKKYLLLLLEPGLSNNKTNIDVIFQPFEDIKFAYQDVDISQENRGRLESFEGYIDISTDNNDSKYIKCIVLLLKIIEKIIDEELSNSQDNGLLKILYDTFDELIDNEDDNSNNFSQENIKKLKKSYQEITTSLDDIKVSNIFDKINRINRIPKFKNLGYYINFNGFKINNGGNKKNFIKVLIFLLYNIDHNNKFFSKYTSGVDSVSFSTIFDNNVQEEGTDYTITEEQFNKADNIAKDACLKIKEEMEREEAEAAARRQAEEAAAASQVTTETPTETPTEPVEGEEESEGAQAPPTETPTETPTEPVEGEEESEGAQAPPTETPTEPVEPVPSSGGKKKQTQKSRRKFSKNKTR